MFMPQSSPNRQGQGGYKVLEFEVYGDLIESGQDPANLSCQCNLGEFGQL